MSPRKLTPEDKQEMIRLYRETDETSSSLAKRFEVSSSTVSRLLKLSFSPEEYEELIQEKRSNRFESDSKGEIASPEPPSLPHHETVPEIEETSPTNFASSSWRRRRSSAVLFPEIQPETVEENELNLEIEDHQPQTEETETHQPLEEEKPPREFEKPLSQLDLFTSLVPESSPLSPLEETELTELDQDYVIPSYLGEEMEDLEDDLEDDLEEEEWEEEPELMTSFYGGTPSTIAIQINPFSPSSIPRTCYIVVDRACELITRPLKEFRELGIIPTEEVQQRTLPIFDNHRTARRFSNRSQRIIKIPDGRLFIKTCPHLFAKGITRLLIDGQVYALN